MTGPSASAPLTQYIAKIHSRCDLACDHCYVYEAKDEGWRRRPAVMPAQTLSTLADRVLEHARSHRLDSVAITLHGGEPLLAGHARIAQYAATLRSTLAPIPSVDLRVHTNGVRLDENFCEIFSEYDIKVGISLDGHQAANDLHRRFADGRSSFPFVERALHLLREDKYRHIYAGLLCTVDAGNDPIAVYEALRSFDPPRIDFLLPHATWDEPPTRRADNLLGADPATLYADWLIAVFTRWRADGRPMAIRFFDSIESLARGGPSGTEALGTGPADLVVIEPDGSFEQVDSLAVVGDGAAATGLDIFQHTVDDAAAHPGIAARRQGLSGLCETCRACPVVDICGGGLYTHRYRSGRDFDNPSVYCDDLKKLITHVTSTPPPVKSSPSRLRESAGQGPLDEATISELAAGAGGAGAVAQLAAAQRELLGILLVGLSEHAGELPGWELLTRLDAEQPDALDTTLSHPFVRRWAEEALVALRTPAAERKTPPMGYLTGVAAAAAIRSGVEAQVEIPVIDGAVHLPTLGSLLVGTSHGAVTVLSHAGGFTVAGNGVRGTVRLDTTEWEPGESTDCNWLPVRRLRAEDDGTSGHFECVIDDTDPYRDCFVWPTARRLDDPSLGRWQDFFAEGWALLRRDYPAYVPGIRAGLTTITPVEVPGEGDFSASGRNTFGAIGMALPHDAATMALLLIHEWQHVRLWAVYDHYDLYDPDDERLYYAAWRRDPRPLAGLLQGTYAHVGVTDFWRIRRTTAERAEERERAATEFVRWREMTAAAIETMATCGSMTAMGVRFLDGMRESIEPWLGEPVPASALLAGRAAAERHQASWRRDGRNPATF